MTKSTISNRNIAFTAILSALSIVLYMLVKFPLPMIFPSFLDIQISDLPALIATFSMGTPYGVIVLIIKILFKLPFTGTACVGELADLILGLCYIIPAGLIYSRNKSYKNAITGLFVGMLLVVITSLIINRFLMIPFYVKVMFDGNWNILLNMVKVIYRNVTIDNFYFYYLFLGILPFNIIRCLIVNVITLLVYKRFSKIIKKTTY